MPTVWKTSFEMPLNKLMQSGTIGNTKQLVNSIALLYDTSVKQGLPMAPGTLAGPLLNGNIIVFKKMLSIYFKINSIKNQAGVIKLYTGLIRSILLNIRTVNSQIKTKTTELKTATREITKTTKEISKLQRTISSITVNAKTSEQRLKKLADAKKSLTEKQLKMAKLKIVEIEAKVLIDKYKERILKFIKPKIQLIKDELKKLVKKILFPQLQETKLTLLRKLPVYIKQLVTEFKQKKKDIVDKIKGNVQLVKQSADTIKKVNSLLSKQDKKQFKTLAAQLVKSTNIKQVTSSAALLIGMIEKYPEAKIPSNTKDSCRKAIHKVIELKYEIELKKQELKEKLKSKFKEKKDELIRSIKPKIGMKSPLERLQEIQAKRKEIQDVVKEIRTIVQKAKQLVSLVKVLKKEITTINALVSKYKKIESKLRSQPLKPGESFNDKLRQATKNINYKANPGLIKLLDTQKPGLGEKYKSLNGSKDLTNIKSFITMNLIETVSNQEVVNRAKERGKKKIKELKDKILQSRNPIQTALFNKFLKLAVIGYWTGGAMPLGFVTSPGVIPYRVPMAMNGDSSVFVKNLTRALMLHTKTVSGIYLQPSPSGPVPIPWFGYF